VTRVPTLRLERLKVGEKGSIYSFFEASLKTVKAPNLHEDKKGGFGEKSATSIQKQ